VAARAYPTGYIHAWLAMMLLKHMWGYLGFGVEAQEQLDGYYNDVFFPTERRNPAYRSLIVAEKTAGLVEAVEAALRPTLMEDDTDPSALWGQAVLPVIQAVMQRQLGGLGQSLAALREQSQREVAGYQRHISTLERVIADQQLLHGQLQAPRHLDGAYDQALAVQRQQQAALSDLTARAAWLQEQNTALRQELSAIKHGVLMRVLRRFAPRKS
jgi:hypothetical protein